MFRLILPTVALALALAPTSSASDELDRFQLWNDCAPVSLLVEGLQDTGKSIDLSKRRIETAVRSRLRAARIYSDEWHTNPIKSLGKPYVYVNVNIAGPAFGLQISLWKSVTDQLSGQKGAAMTWTSGATGTHRRNAGYILSAIGEHTDIFIDEYLRVNADACGKSK